MLDEVGVDARVSPGWHAEEEWLLKCVFHEDTVRAIKRYHEVWMGVRRHGRLKCVLEDDVFWHGEVNPRGVDLRKVDVRMGTGDGSEVLTAHGPFYGGGKATGRSRGDVSGIQ